MTYLHMGSSAASAPAVEIKETWQGWWEGFDIMWDINFEFLSLLFINGSQCTFLDVAVTRAVTVSNELHMPLIFISISSIPFSVLRLVYITFMTNYG